VKEKKVRIQSSRVRAPKQIIGIDIGDRISRVCVLSGDCVIVREEPLPTTPEAFRERFDGLGRCRTVIEAGAHSPWISRLLEELGHEVIVANTRQVRLIYESDSKNDRVDARTLARLARVDPGLLRPIHHRTVEAQSDLAVLRARDVLVSGRTKLINNIRGTLKAFGYRFPRVSASSVGMRLRESIPDMLKTALLPMLEHVGHLSAVIYAYDKTIVKLGKTKYPATQLIQQIPGVGSLTGLAFVLTIDDPHRFERSRDVGSYLGLRPRQSDSGQCKPQLSITKAGNGYLRRLLVGCAQYILGHFGVDSDLRRWGYALMSRGGKNAKKRAIVAVARKLAVLMHSLWVSGTVYDPLRHVRAEAA